MRGVLGVLGDLGVLGGRVCSGDAHMSVSVYSESSAMMAACRVVGETNTGNNKKISTKPDNVWRDGRCDVGGCATQPWSRDLVEATVVVLLLLCVRSQLWAYKRLQQQLDSPGHLQVKGRSSGVSAVSVATTLESSQQPL